MRRDTILDEMKIAMEYIGAGKECRMIQGKGQITGKEKHAQRRWILRVGKQVTYSRGSPSFMISLNGLTA